MASSAMSPTRLRQIALVASDLAKARHQLTTVLGTEVVFVDPGVGKWGLENFLGRSPRCRARPLLTDTLVVPVGGDMIEVVSPTRPGTTAGRLLAKRGDGGYMLIMQTLDAGARRAHIESNGLAKVIWEYEHDDVTCVQYHPRGVKGGLMPELDSHTPSPSNPVPLTTRFSPWHACGPDYISYSAGMKRTAHLALASAVCRLGPGDGETQGAARQWESTFGLSRRESELHFTNAQVQFVPGREGEAEGLESITIAVEGAEQLNGIWERAREEGLWEDGGINMVGVKWYLVLVGDTGAAKSRL